MKFEDAKIWIALLEYPYIETECVASTLGMYEYSKYKCPGKNIPRNEIELSFESGTSPSRAHNKAINNMLNDPRGFKALLIVGRDHIFKADALQKLFETDKDIIGGITTARLRSLSQVKEPVWSIVSDWQNGIPITLTRVQCLEKMRRENYQPFEVPVLGDGLMLIKRKVFERLNPPWFYEPPIPKEERPDTKNVTMGTIGCDILFCRRAREAGFKIWAHPGVQYIHIGKHYAAVQYQID